MFFFLFCEEGSPLGWQEEVKKKRGKNWQEEKADTRKVMNKYLKATEDGTHDAAKTP